MSTSIRIMLVEDHAGYREAIITSLKRHEDLTIHSRFATAEIALRKLQLMHKQEIPDILILDLNLPGMSGLQAIPWFRDYAPDLKILILSQSNAEEDILKAISLGASGYLLKSSRFRKIAESINVVMEGGAALDPKIAKLILSKFKNLKPKNITPDKELSPREVEILSLLAEGLSKKEIANRLEISSTTVAYHVRHIYEKLEVVNAPAAVAKGFLSGILPSQKSTD